jgi:hypothetical protein
VGTGPSGLAVGDLNEDGLPDIVSADHLAGTISVVLATGNGNFRAARAYAAGPAPNSVAIGDIDGDGHQDVVVANRGSRAQADASVSIWLGKGNGDLVATSGVAAGREPTCVALGDFNGDGQPDLAVAAGADNKVSVLMHRPRR